MKKQLANKMSQDDCKHLNYNNLQLPRYIKGAEGGEMQSQTNQQLNA